MDCILSDNFITTHENTMLAKTVVKKKSEWSQSDLVQNQHQNLVRQIYQYRHFS